MHCEVCSCIQIVGVELLTTMLGLMTHPTMILNTYDVGPALVGMLLAAFFSVVCQLT